MMTMVQEQTPGEGSSNIAEQAQSIRLEYTARHGSGVIKQFDALVSAMRIISGEKSEDTSDPYMKALFSCLVEDMEQDTFMHEILLEYAASNPDDKIPVGMRKLYSSFQELIIPLPDMAVRMESRHKPLLDPIYPAGYDDSGKWVDVVSYLKQDTFGERVAFGQNLLKPLQSSILTRFLATMIAPQLFGIARPNMLSEGSSFALLENMAISYKKDGVGLERYRIGSLTGSNPKRPLYNHRTAAAKRSKEELAGLVNDPAFSLGHVLGVDYDHPFDQQNRSYAYSNCFRGPEFQDEWYRETVAKLILKQPDTMRLIRGDYTAADHVAEVRRKAPQWFKLPNRWVTFISTQYQHDQTARQIADENARQLAGRKGYVLHMDFAELNSGGTLDFPGSWPNWSYSMFVTPPGVDKPLHILRMRNGRAMDMAPGADMPTDDNGLPIFEFGIMRDALAA